MTWNKITTQTDADELMTIFGSFHDACFREAHLWTDSYVSSELRMACPDYLDNKIRILFQRQFKNPSAVELLFEDVTRFNLVPTPENYDHIIYNAIILVRHEAIYWSPCGDWDPNGPEKDEDTWILAKKLSWRVVDWMGKELRYGPKEE